MTEPSSSSFASERTLKSKNSFAELLPKFSKHAFEKETMAEFVTH